MMRTRKVFHMLFGAAVLLLASCARPVEQPPAPRLRFVAPVTLDADQEFRANLGVQNTGAQDFAGDDRFGGQMEIRDASGDLRASAEVVTLRSIAAGDTAWIVEWRGVLSPGDYRLTWGADKYGFVTVAATVVERNGRLYLAEEAPPAVVEPAPSFTEAPAVVDLLPVLPSETAYRQVEIPEAGIRFEIPAGWGQLTPETVWTPEDNHDLRIGFTWTTLEPPFELEAALLPDHAQIVASEPLALGWGDGRSFTLEVYGTAAPGGEQAPVEALEIHALVTLSVDGERRGFDFYVSAPTAEQLAEIGPILTHALETAVFDRPDVSGEDRTAGWPVLSDETYGFQLAHPEDWTHKDLVAQGGGMPGDWPVQRVVIFFPQDWADRFERSGPPEPDAPPAIPALSLEVCVGSETQFRRAYVEPSYSETLTINGVEVVREESGSGEYVTVLYVFQNPANPDVRVLFVDNFSKFANRAAENPEVVELIPVIVGTFAFAQ